MGVFKLFQGATYIKKLRLGLLNIRLFLARNLLYQIPISGATATCSTVTYNGDTQIAQNISVIISGQTLTDGTDYTVTSNSGGINAGSYSFTVSGINYFNNSVNGTFIINPKSVSPAITLSQSEYTYSGSQCEPTPTVKDGNTVIPSSEYTVTYSNNINAGTATCTITNKSGGNYIIATTSENFTINKADPIYTAPTANNRTYDTTSKALLNAGAVTGGTMYYSSDNSTWSASIPSGTTAGTYTSYWKITGDSNHNDKVSSSISTTISKAAGSVTTAPTANSLIYDNTDQTLVTAGSGTGTMLYKLSSGSWGTSIPTGKAAGDYTVYYKASASTNYNESASGSVAVNIAKVTPTVTAPTAKSLTYNGNPQALVNAGSTNWGTLQYSLDNSTWSTNIPNGIDATGYTVYYKVVGNANINDVAAQSVNVTIAKADPTYTAPTKKTGLVYNGDAQSLLNAGSTSHGTFKYSTDNSTWSTSIPSGTTASTYTVYWKLDGDSNHNSVSSTEITGIDISKVTPTVTAPTPKTLTFNNENQVLANDGSTDYGTIQYCLNNSGGTYSNSVPSASAANTTYKVWYKVVGDSNVNDVAPDSIDCMIAEKRVTTPTIELDPSSYTYNGSSQIPTTVTVKDGTTVIPSSEYNVVYSNNINAGTATVTITDKDAGNYYISGSTTFTIDKVTPTVTAPTAKSLTYNTSAQTLANAGSTDYGTMQYSSTSGGTYGSTIPQGTNAGSYEVWYKVVGDSNVNDVAPAKINCSIAKASGTATVAGTTNTYDGTAKNLVTVSNNTGTMHYKVDSGGWSTTLPQATNAGSWTIYWSMDESTNYTGVASSDTRYVSSSIGKASGSVTTAPTAKSLTYNASEQALVTAGSGTGTMLYKLGTGSWGTNIPTAINATTYTVYYKASASTNYEESSSGSVSVTISAVTPTVTPPTAKSLTYNTSAQALVNAGSTDYGTLVYSTTQTGTYTANIPQGTNAGSYEVWYKVNGDANINSTNPTKVSVTISKADQAAPTAIGATTTYNTTATATASGGGGHDSIEWSNGNTQTSVGSKTTSARWNGNSNYNPSPWSNAVTVTMNKAAGSVTINGVSLTYNGTARNLATVTGPTGTMHYSTNGTSWSTTIPQSTNAGSWNVYWYMDASTNYEGIASASSRYVSSSIAKADQAAPTATGATTTYPTTATATASGGGGQGSIEWESAQSQSSVGSHTTRARWSGNGNYNASPYSSYVTVQMNKAAGSVTTAPTNSNPTYGSGNYLCTAGSGTGTMLYKLGSGSYSSTRPTTSGLNAGSYTLYYKASASTNYNESSEASITVTVAKASQSAPTAYGATVCYGNTATASASGGGGQGSIEWSNGNSRTAVGTTSTAARWSGNSNYNASSYSSAVNLTVTATWCNNTTWTNNLIWPS